jgi:hypothetical protein
MESGEKTAKVDREANDPFGVCVAVRSVGMWWARGALGLADFVTGSS